MPLVIPYLLSASSRRGLIRCPLDWNPLTLYLLHPSGHVELMSHFGLLYKVTLILHGPTDNRGSPLPLRLQGCLLLLQTGRILHRQGGQQLIRVELVGIRVQGIRCKLEIHWPPVVILPHYSLARWHLLSIQGFVLFRLIVRLSHAVNHWVRKSRSWLSLLIELHLLTKQSHGGHIDGVISNLLCIGHSQERSLRFQTAGLWIQRDILRAEIILKREVPWLGIDLRLLVHSICEVVGT